MTFRILAAAVSMSLVLPGHALACSPPRGDMTDADVLRGARAAVDRATAIVDAEVLALVSTASRPPFVSRMRVIRAWKGGKRETIEVVASGTCDIDFPIPGARHRLILSGGPGRYTADLAMNGVSGGDVALFEREVDRLLGDPRPRDFESVGIVRAPPPR